MICKVCNLDYSLEEKTSLFLKEKNKLLIQKNDFLKDMVLKEDLVGQMWPLVQNQ